MRKICLTLTLILLGLSVAIGVLSQVPTCTSHDFSGYAWSSNIGWISFSCNGHWQLVDEVIADDDLTVAWTDSVTEEKDFYEIEELPPSVTSIVNIDVTAKYSGSLKFYMILDGVEKAYTSSSTAIPWGVATTDWSDHRPGGGSWTVDDIDNLQIGFGISSVFGLPGKITQAYVEITDGLGGTHILRPNGTGDYTNISNPSVGSDIDYGVDFDEETGLMSGYAWSSSIGWISFNASDLSGCPSGTCNATIDLPTGDITGWARAISPVGEDPEKAGGWDGWISLSGAGYPLNINYTPDPSEVDGYAWGSDVVGWISFNCINTGVCGSSNYKVTVDHSYNVAPLVTDPNSRDTSGDSSLNCSASNPPVFLDWTFTDPGDSQSSYQIQIDSESSFSPPILIDTGKVFSSSETYAPSGLAFSTSYYWRIQVWDSLDLSSEWVYPSPTSFTTNSRWPNPDFTWTPLEPIAEEDALFTNETLYCSAGCSYSWDFGDGGTSSAVNPTYTYSAEGSYTIILTATDSSTGSCIGSNTIDVDDVDDALPLPIWQEIIPF